MYFSGFYCLASGEVIKKENNLLFTLYCLDCVCLSPNFSFVIENGVSSSSFETFELLILLTIPEMTSQCKLGGEALSRLSTHHLVQQRRGNRKKKWAKGEIRVLKDTQVNCNPIWTVTFLWYDRSETIRSIQSQYLA